MRLAIALELQAALRRHPKGDDPEGLPGGAEVGGKAAIMQEGDRGLFLGRAHYGCVATVITPPITGRGRKVPPPSPPLGHACLSRTCMGQKKSLRLALIVCGCP